MCRDVHQTIIQLVKKGGVVHLDYNQIQLIDTTCYMVLLSPLVIKKRVKLKMNIYLKMIKPTEIFVCIHAQCSEDFEKKIPHC